MKKCLLLFSLWLNNPSERVVVCFLLFNRPDKCLSLVHCAAQQFSELQYLELEEAADLQLFFFFFNVSLIRTPEPSLRGLCQRDLFSLGGNDVTKSSLTCDFRSLNNADACTLVLPPLTLSQQGEMQLQLMKWSRGIFEWGQSISNAHWLTDWLAEWMNTGLPVLVTDRPT